MKILPWILKTWKIVSYPLIGDRCRFHPSCSEYLVEAIRVHGWRKGIILGLRRLSRCHPLCKTCGCDPVPEKSHLSSLADKS